MHGLLHDVLIQRFFVQDDIRTDYPAAAAARHAFTVIHDLLRIGLAAARAVGAKNAAVQFQNLFASRCLMQTVDILRDDGAQLAGLLQLSQLAVRLVRLYALDHQLFPVEAVVLLRVSLKKAVAENLLGRILPFLVIQTVHAAEIGNAALGAHTGPAEENDVVALLHPVIQFSDSFNIHILSPRSRLFTLSAPLRGRRCQGPRR